MCVLDHPYRAVDSARKERREYEDGLWARFLAHCPMPPFFDAKEIRRAVLTTISLTSIFFVINKIHVSKHLYTFAEGNATKVADEHYSYYKAAIKETNRTDINLRLIYF